MKIKFGLRPKFIIMFIIFAMILSGTIASVIEKNYASTITEKYYDQAVSIAKLSASVLDGDRIKIYVKTGERTKEYEADLERLNNIKRNTNAYYIYVMYPINKEEGIYIFDTYMTEEQIELVSGDAATLGDKVFFGDDFSSAMKVLEEGKPSESLDITTTMQGDIEQTLASAYAPVFDSEGNVIAFAGVDMNMTDVNTYIKKASVEVMETVLIVELLCVCFLLFVLGSSVLKPVKNLTKAAENLSNGKYDNAIKAKGNDEISEITKVFSRMSTNIKGHIDEINVINEAYHKYVPSRFFELLQKKSVTEVKLGNQRQQEMTVLNFNIVDFDYLIRQMNSEEMFAFINDVLQHAIPDIVESQGMVETFHEGGFTALYENNCERALSSAISICQKMNRLNEDKHFGVQEIVQFGVGITYGSVMLGIVGHDKRMSAISISQQTQIAEFLQKLTQKYYSRILITGTAAAQIENFSELYHARVIGYIYNTFTNQMEKIYDVYDGDEKEDIKRKDITKAMFEQGVNLYYAGKFYEARNAFVEVLKQFRKDAAAREYLFLCNQYYQQEDLSNIDICIERF